MTLAAVDRLVHHSTIFELNVESYRRRVAAREGGFKAKSNRKVDPGDPVTPTPVADDRNDEGGGATMPRDVGGARGDASVPLRSTEASPRAKEQTKTTSKATTTSKAKSKTRAKSKTNPTLHNTAAI